MHESVRSSPAVRCPACRQLYRYRHNILDTLVQPSEHVIRELQGLAREAGWDPERWEEIKVRCLPEVKTFEERLRETDDSAKQYHRQTLMNFEQAFFTLGPFRPTRVLEIGAQTDFPFLAKFRSLGAECHAVNIHFFYEDPDRYVGWPEKTLADMNRLPFSDGVFDIVVMSATSHHSPTLDTAIGELARVLKPQGRALVTSDPLSGWLKRLGGSMEHDRDSLINESAYSLFRYHRAFRRSGLTPSYLFSAYYDKKLANAEIRPGTRFATLARIVARAWRVPAVRQFSKRRLLPVACVVFGFPLNVVLTKAGGPPPAGSAPSLHDRLVSS